MTEGKQDTVGQLKRSELSMGTRGACLVTYKEVLIFFRRRAGTNEGQTPNLIGKVGKIQRLMKAHPKQRVLCQRQGHVWGNMAGGCLDECP